MAQSIFELSELGRWEGERSGLTTNFRIIGSFPQSMLYFAQYLHDRSAPFHNTNYISDPGLKALFYLWSHLCFQEELDSMCALTTRRSVVCEELWSLTLQSNPARTLHYLPQ